MVSSIFSTSFERFLPHSSPTGAAALKAAIDSGRVEDAMEILKSDSLLDKPLPNGQLPLNYAIRLEKFHIVKKIFQDLKPNIDTRDYQGLTSIDHAIIGGNQEMKALVLQCSFGNSFKDCMNELNQKSTQASADDLLSEISKLRSIDMSKSGEMHLAARDGELSKLKNLAALGGNINQSDHNGLTPLHYACLFGQKETAQWLLSKESLLRARADILSSDRKSALHFAAIGGHSEIVQIVLAATGISPNVRDAKQRTPLHYAALADHQTAASMLIQKGANPIDREAGATPAALLMHQIQKQSDLRDPLKLDTLSMMMFSGFVGSWILRLFDEGNGLQALDWVSTASSSSFFLQDWQNPDQRKAFGIFLLLTGCRYSGDPDLQEASCIMPYALTLNLVFQGIKKNWQGLTYETYRPLRNIAVHVFSGASSLCGLFGRMAYIGEERIKSHCHGSYGQFWYKEWNEELRICEPKVNEAAYNAFHQQKCEAQKALDNKMYWKWNKDSKRCEGIRTDGSGFVYRYGSNDLCNIGDWKEIGDCMIESGKNLSQGGQEYRSDAAKVLALLPTTSENCPKEAKFARRNRSAKYYGDHCKGDKGDMQKLCKQEPQRCPGDIDKWCDEAWHAVNLAQDIACNAKYPYSATEL